MERKSTLDLSAMLVLTILCASWGFSQVAIKVANRGISPLLQGGIRSVVAAALLLGWMLLRRQPLLKRDGSLGWGLAAGLLFSVEFMLIYWGLDYTSASRAVIFLYTMPFMVALGAWRFLPGEGLAGDQLCGLLCAFAGILLVFGDAQGTGTPGGWIGDGMLIAAALMWAATTILIKASPLVRIPPAKTLLYQLGCSALLLPVASLLVGEPGVVHLTPVEVGSLAYQAVWVAFVTYLVWFWLVQRYPAPHLSAFMFLTPLFGVLSGVIFLEEPLSTALLGGLCLVGVGIYLVNRPHR